MTAFKKIAATSVMLGMLVPALAFAQTPPGAQALVEQIKALQAQMKTLHDQQQALAQQQQTLAGQQGAAMGELIRTLRQGVSGDDVKALQALLATDPSIYPDGTVSGFFGRKTAEAVKRFQRKHGIEQAGNVGPRTLKKLNELMREHPMAWDNATSSDDREGRRGEDKRPCAIVPPGHLIAPGWLRKHEGDTDRPVVPPCQKIPGGIWDKLTDGDNHDRNGTSTTQDMTPPVISAISSSNITATGAKILWTTNENSVDRIEYGTTTAYGMTTAPMFKLPGNQNAMLSGLTQSTMYHYRITATDLRGNVATSSDMSFTTVTPDTAAPVISGVSVSPIAATTATVGWTTNEVGTSKVYYSLATPVDLGSALTVSNPAYTLSHSIGLTSLTASTTYYYVVESKDGSNNVATTSTASFVTTN